MANMDKASLPVSEGHGTDGPVYRSTLALDKLMERPSDDVHSMADMLDSGRRNHGSKPLIATRKVIREHKEEKVIKKKVGDDEVEEKKMWTYYELSPYSFITLNEFCERTNAFASGLAALGMSKGLHFNIFATTAVNWQIVAQSCFRIGMTLCTAYDTLGPEGLQVSLEEPDVQALFTNAEHLPVLEKIIDQTPLLRTVIYDGEPDLAVVQSIERHLQGRPNARVVRFDEVIQLGLQNPVPRVKTTEQDVACIMYTSGSTGKPKGVILTHGNLIATITAIRAVIGPYIRPNDSFMAYLPLAHILEFVVECWSLFDGIQFGYGRVKTLTSASVRNSEGDLIAFKPTLLIGVPSVWETIRKGILTKLHKSSPLKQRIFHLGMWAKVNRIPGLAQLADQFVFSAVRQQTGGRLRLALSGGAPISFQTHRFLNTVLVPILQGYGMTESSAMCALLTPQFFKYQCVGNPMPSIEARLRDVPEAGYKWTNSPPQGEVMIRGPSVTQGYYKRPDLTAETITDDGWLMTGDIGQMNEDGTIKLIDRKKNLVKLAGGEYVAIERLESTYKACGLISNICVLASSDAKQPMGVIFPREESLRHKLEDLGMKDLLGLEFEDLCARREVTSILLKETNETGKSAGLVHMEMLQCVLATAEELPVTAAQKIQRKDVERKFKSQIDAIYP